MFSKFHSKCNMFHIKVCLLFTDGSGLFKLSYLFNSRLLCVYLFLMTFSEREWALANIWLKQNLIDCITHSYTHNLRWKVRKIFVSNLTEILKITRQLQRRFWIAWKIRGGRLAWFLFYWDEVKFLMQRGLATWEAWTPVKEH